MILSELFPLSFGNSEFCAIDENCFCFWIMFKVGSLLNFYATNTHEQAIKVTVILVDTIPNESLVFNLSIEIKKL